MWIMEPSEILAIGKDRLINSGIMEIQKNRMEHALTHVNAIPDDETVADASAFINDSCGIVLSKEQFLGIFSLYPTDRGKLADYLWGDTEICDMTLDVIAHFFLSTQWPRNGDDVLVDEFIDMLGAAASYMGYTFRQAEQSSS